MVWNEVKKWAKEKGYKAGRQKIEGSEKSYDYTWIKIDDPACSGVAKSVSKLAKVIFNNITNNIWVEHQEAFSKSLKIEIKPDGY